MELSARDERVLQLVDWFGQLSSSHIRELAFADVSDTPADRALKRLVKLKLLRRVGRRASDELKGGAGGFVYQLGKTGWHHMRDGGTWWRHREPNPHTLMMADIFVLLVLAERQGTIKILECELEHPVGRGRADIYVKLGLVARNLRVSYYIEADRSGRQRKATIGEKCNNYRASYQDAPKDVSWPYVVFITPHVERQRELQGWLRRYHNVPGLFHVINLGEVVERLVIM